MMGDLYTKLRAELKSGIKRTYTVRFTDNMVTAIRVIAAENEQTASSFIRDALEYWLKELHHRESIKALDLK